MVARSWILGCLVFWTAGCAQQPVTVRADAPDAPDPAVAASADVDPETVIERSDSTHLLAPKQVVRIDNPFGDVRIRFGGYESQLEWRGVAQNSGSEHKLSAIGSATEAFEIAVRLPAGTTVIPGQRLDLTAYVPEGHDLQINTEQGLIEVRGLHANVYARSRSGDISFRGIRGLVDVETGGGNIEGQLNKAPAGSQQRVATQTGTIILGLVDELNAALTLATSGVFATDFSIHIDPQPGQEPNKTARAEIGKPEANIEVVSKRGEIRLLRRLGFRPA